MPTAARLGISSVYPLLTRHSASPTNLTSRLLIRLSRSGGVSTVARFFDRFIDMSALPCPLNVRRRSWSPHRASESPGSVFPGTRTQPPVVVCLHMTDNIRPRPLFPRDIVGHISADRQQVDLEWRAG